MLGTKDLARISDLCSVVKAQTGSKDAHKPFGGLNVILFGDFHQFPPVGDPKTALYMPPPATAAEDAQRGFSLYRQFDDVVLLKEQMRVQDSKWMSMLENLRSGDCDAEQVGMVKDLVLGSANCPQIWMTTFGQTLFSSPHATLPGGLGTRRPSGNTLLEPTTASIVLLQRTTKDASRRL